MGYLLTTLTDPYVGRAAQRRNMRRFDVYLLVTVAIWACRLARDFAKCPAYPGPGNLLFWMVRAAASPNPRPSPLAEPQSKAPLPESARAAGHSSSR